MVKPNTVFDMPMCHVSLLFSSEGSWLGWLWPVSAPILFLVIIVRITDFSKSLLKDLPESPIGPSYLQNLIININHCMVQSKSRVSLTLMEVYTMIKGAGETFVHCATQ